MKKLCHRFFAPGANSPMANLGLLLLRVWLGCAMLLNHGWDKISHFGAMSEKFANILPIGSSGNLALAVFAEFFCSGLLVIGLLSRFAALVLAINLAVAFTVVHKMSVTGEHSGELAFIYLAGYVSLLLAGPGRYSADSSLFDKA